MFLQSGNKLPKDKYLVQAHLETTIPLKLENPLNLSMGFPSDNMNLI